jgi:hypothetical protein
MLPGGTRWLGVEGFVVQRVAIDLPALRNRPQQSPIYDAGRDPPGVDALQMNACRKAYNLG